MVRTPINAANSEHFLPIKGENKVQCPECQAWRPAICITKTVDGEWIGDCCLTRRRRDGETIETQYVEE